MEDNTMKIYVVGSSKNKFLPLDNIREKFLIDKKHDGNNIDFLNPWYCELTGLYYLWKHVDDDVIYPDYFLQDFVLAANANPESIISNNMCRGTFLSQQCVNGAATLYRPKFFTPFLWEGLIKQVVETNEDDQWYTFCIWLFGQRPVKYIPLKMLFFNEVGEHQYTNGVARNILLNYWKLLINKKEILKDDGTTEIVFINPPKKEKEDNE